MGTTNPELVNEINKNLAILLPGEISLNEMQARLTSYINQLIQEDFQKLIVLLYRIDVSESKLKQLLLENRMEDAGSIIAVLIIDRQLEKMKSREQFGMREDDFTGEEKW